MAGRDSDTYLQKILTLVESIGEKDTAKLLGVKKTTISRRAYEARKRGVAPIIGTLSKNLIKIKETYSDDEIAAIAKGGRVSPGLPSMPIANFNGDVVTFGVISDTHIGSIYTDNSHILRAFNKFDEAKVDFVVHAGDVTEGLSNRAGHIYEVNQIGYTAQKKAAIEILKHCPAQLYMIDGNHDRWYVKGSGAYIVEDIAKELGAVYLGQDEGDIALKHHITLKLWHGEDGNTYAISYRMQKIVESLTGGTKPHIIIAGHVHKMMYNWLRHIHCIGAGSIQMQSKWMRSKRLEAHTGFWVIKAWLNDAGVGRFQPTWYPLYV